MTNYTSTMAYILVWDQSRSISIWSTSFEQAPIKESICNAKLYILIVQHLSNKTNHKESFRERPRYFKDISYKLYKEFWRTWKDRLPYIENNSISSANVAWRCGESFGGKKNTPNPSPTLLYKKKKVEQWIKGGSFILECSSISEQCLKHHTVAQNAIWKPI